MQRCLRTLLVCLTPLFSSGAVAASDTSAGAPRYAAVKHPTLKIESRSILKYAYRGPYPDHGLLLAYGSFISAGASWIIVDFDAASVERIITITQTLPDGEREGIVSSRSEQRISPTQLDSLIVAANQVWDPPPIVLEAPRLGGTDSACDLVLFDGPEILHDWGFQCQSKRLLETVEALGAPAR